MGSGTITERPSTANGNGTAASGDDEPEAPETEQEGADASAGEDEDTVAQLSIEGDHELTLQLRGRKPDDATLSISKQEIKIVNGQFDRGQRVRVVLEGYIVGSNDVDHRREGEITHTTRKLSLKPDLVRKERVGG